MTVRSKYELGRKGATCPGCGGYKHHRAKQCYACFHNSPETKRAQEHLTHQARRRMKRAIGLRRKGLLNDQIAKRMGTTGAAAQRLLSRARQQGLTVPESPYFARGPRVSSRRRNRSMVTGGGHDVSGVIHVAVGGSVR